MKGFREVPSMSLRHISGVFLIAAAITFWLGWMLMPEAGTADPAYILNVVAGRRTEVWWSSVVHWISSILFVLGIIGIQNDMRVIASGWARLGAALALLGAMGVCLDGFFHLVAYYLTADGVQASAVLEPMRLLQTQGLVFLVPLLLALIIGGALYSVGLARAGVASRRPRWVFVIAIVWAVAGGVIAARTGSGRRVVVLVFLGLVAAGYGWIGYEVARGRAFRRRTA
jgi:hypothetical protein